MGSVEDLGTFENRHRKGGVRQIGTCKFIDQFLQRYLHRLMNFIPFIIVVHERNKNNTYVATERHLFESASAGATFRQ